MASTALAGAGPPRRRAPGLSEPPDPAEEPRWEFLVEEQPEEWLPFRLSVHRVIEQTYLEPSSHDGEWQLVVEDGGQEYFLDLEAMVQTNTATHQQRRIRRNTRTSATNLAALLERERSESRQLASQLEREQAQKDQAEGRVAEQSRKLQEESARLAEARRVVRMQRHETEVWRHSHLPGNEVSLRTAMPDQSLLVAAQAALRRTSHSTVSSRCLNMQSAIVTRVQPIINGPLWEEYTRTKARIEADQNTVEPVLPGVPPIISESFPWLAAHLNTQINERLAFHGTSGGNVSTIAERGFDEHCADEDCLYGMGIYFAEESCKSFQYCGTRDERCIVLVRIVLGKAYIAKGQLKGLRRPPLIIEGDASAGRYDSVVVNRGIPHGTGTTQLHREFVLFSGRQAYPELAIYFKI